MKNKKLLIFSTGISLLSVFVGALSTLAWFQLDSQAPNATITTHDPNLNIDNQNVTGYKVVPTIGSDGFINKTSNTVTSKKGEVYDTSNSHQDIDDHDFDVPSDGLGYYLVKQNPAGTFKYNYNNQSYARKFTEYSDTTIYNKYVENDATNFLDCKVGDVFEIKQYSYNSSEKETINQQVTNFTSANSSVATVDSYYNITVQADGIYKVWYNTQANSNIISFESITTPAYYQSVTRNRIVNQKEDNGTNENFNESTLKTSKTTTAANLYIRGTMNNWGTSESYRFVTDTDIEDKWVLRGAYLVAGQGFVLDGSTWDSNSYKSNKLNGLGTASDNFYHGARSGITWNVSDSNANPSKTVPTTETYVAANNVTIKCTLPSWWWDDNYVSGLYVDNFNSQNNSYKYAQNSRSANTSTWTGVNLETYYKGIQFYRSGTLGGSWSNSSAYYNINDDNSNCYKINDNNIAVLKTGYYDIYVTQEWFIKTDYAVYNVTLNTNGGTINSGNITSYTYGTGATLPTNITRPGYRFLGWYTNADFSGNPVTTISNTANGDKTFYAKWIRQYSVSLNPSYFLDDGSGTYPIRLSGITAKLSDGSNQVATTQLNDEGSVFSTSITFGNSYYLDTANAIAYTFTRESGNIWYSDPECTTVYSGTPTSDSSPGNLYAKMICAPLETYYIDISQTGWSGCNIQGWDTAKGLSSVGNAPGVGSSFSAKSIINNKLYKITLPNDFTGFITHNGYSGGGVNQSNNITRMSGYNYLLLGNLEGSNRWAGWMEEKSIYGGKTARIYIKTPGNSFPSESNAIVMNAGDGSTNDFVYEKGLEIPVGSEIYIKIDGEDTYFKYDEYIYSQNIGDLTPSYIRDAGDDSDHNVLTQNYTGTMRFNFYITTDGNLSIAMVPLMGNGYYIMPYNSNLTRPTDTYAGAIKMDSSDYSAIYTGFYNAGGSSNSIFIKSYINGVDKLCNSLTTTSSEYAQINNGVITFLIEGRYTIQVTNRQIDITPYQITDFFRLNSLDTSTVTGTDSQKQAAIFNQKTSLILEVPFTCDNPYNSNITLTTTCESSFIGISFCVRTTRINNGDPASVYSTMRGTDSSNMSSYYTGLSAANGTINPITTVSDISSVPANNDGTTYYAYILIDYLPNVTEANVIDSMSAFKIYLQSNQI